MVSIDSSNKRRWAVLVFMLADDNTLEPFALINLKQLQRIGDPQGFDVLSEVHWGSGEAERFVLRDRNLVPIARAESSQETGVTALRSFLSDALRDYPADHYALMLWGHAYGFGFGAKAPLRITFAELAAELRAFRAARGGTDLEILASAACGVGKIEAVYELRGVVRYLVSSQVGVPYEGWPLKSSLSRLMADPSIPPGELARTMVEGYCEHFRRRTVAMTALDLEEADSLLLCVRRLADLLFASLEGGDGEIRAAHEAFVHAANEDDEVEPLVDVVELCSHLIERSPTSAIRDVAREIVALLEEASFVATHDAVGPAARGLHGISVYVPHVTLDPTLPIFDALGLEHARLWTEVVERLRATNKHVAVLEALERLEKETLALED